MAAAYACPAVDTLDDVSSQLAASRLTQRLSRDSATLGPIRGVRSSRIEKPRSSQNSPQGIQRRRTTSYPRTHAFQHPVPDALQQYQYGVDLSQPCQARQAARPVTWHPALSQHVPPPVTDYHPHMAMPMADLGFRPHHPQLAAFARPFAPTAADQAWLAQHQYANHPHPTPSDPAWAPYQAPTGDHEDSSTPAVQQDHPARHLPEYPAEYADAAISTLPPEQPWRPFEPFDTTLVQQPPELVEDTTPQMQQTTLDGAAASEAGDRVLVGLGLYDPPATPPHPFALTPRRGKGLKLEEPWAPPPLAAAEDLDGEGEDDDDDEDFEAALPPSSQDVVAQMQMQMQTQTQKQAALFGPPPWALPQQDAVVTAGAQPGLGLGQEEQHRHQPFFFGAGEDLGGEWWYGPAAGLRAQEHGFGQDWLNA